MEENNMMTISFTIGDLMLPLAITAIFYSLGFFSEEKRGWYMKAKEWCRLFIAFIGIAFTILSCFYHFYKS